MSLSKTGFSMQTFRANVQGQNPSVLVQNRPNAGKPRVYYSVDAADVEKCPCTKPKNVLVQNPEMSTYKNQRMSLYKTEKCLCTKSELKESPLSSPCPSFQRILFCIFFLPSRACMGSQCASSLPGLCTSTHRHSLPMALTPSNARAIVRMDDPL
eukprot:6270999-Amphidinium_carterae.2